MKYWNNFIGVSDYVIRFDPLEESQKIQKIVEDLQDACEVELVSDSVIVQTAVDWFSEQIKMECAEFKNGDKSFFVQLKYLEQVDSAWELLGEYRLHKNGALYLLDDGSLVGVTMKLGDEVVRVDYD